MENKKRFSNIVNKVNKAFCEFMEGKGVAAYLHEEREASTMGHGGFASPDDSFAINYDLCLWPYPLAVSLHLKDRNGNLAIDGPTVAIYSFNINENMTDEDVIKLFNEMLSDAYEKYSIYSRNNRLDFSFNNLEMERVEYPKKGVEK